MVSRHCWLLLSQLVLAMCKLTLFRLIPAVSCRKKPAETHLQLLWVRHSVANLPLAMCPPTQFAPPTAAFLPVFAQVSLDYHRTTACCIGTSSRCCFLRCSILFFLLQVVTTCCCLCFFFTTSWCSPCVLRCLFFRSFKISFFIIHLQPGPFLQLENGVRARIYIQANQAIH